MNFKIKIAEKKASLQKEVDEIERTLLLKKERLFSYEEMLRELDENQETEIDTLQSSGSDNSEVLGVNQKVVYDVLSNHGKFARTIEIAKMLFPNLNQDSVEFIKRKYQVSSALTRLKATKQVDRIGRANDSKWAVLKSNKEQIKDILEQSTKKPRITGP